MECDDTQYSIFRNVLKRGCQPRWVSDRLRDLNLKIELHHIVLFKVCEIVDVVGVQFSWINAAIVSLAASPSPA